MSQQSSQLLDPKMRENRGVNRKEVFTDAEYNRALKLRWVFFCRYDKSVLPLYLNHYAWPTNFGFHDKVNIEKGTVLSLKTEDRIFDCQFVETCLQRDYNARSVRAMRILEKAKLNNISIAELTMSLELVVFL